MNTYRCPQLQRINNYINGTLSNDQSQELEKHLDQCNTCGETLRGLAESGDVTLNEELRRVMKDRYDASSPSTSSTDVSPSRDFSSTDLSPKNLSSTNLPESDLHREHESNAGNRSTDQPLIESLVQRLQAQDPKELAQRARINEERAAEVLWVLGGTIDGGTESTILGKLDHYELIELLGSGSTGVVFSALDTRLNREVAIKVLRPSLGSAARSRFLKEARSAASCRHENIVTVFDIGQAEDDHGLAYITMELLPGETLEDRLNRVTFLPEAEVLLLADKIAAALAAAHNQGIIHRDLKPANIWVNGESGDCQQVKLLDFGLARAIDADQQMTATGILAGTPNFMSPEQTRGLELDGRSDLFSLGCLLYRAITGRLPFSSTGVLSTLQAIQHHQPAPPSKLNPSCSAELSSLIMTLLEKQPDLRPASGEDVQHALKTNPDRWRFKPAVGVGDLQTQNRSHPNAGGSRSKRKWNKLIATSLVGLLGWAGWMFGSDIIRIATNQGEIIIETTDKDVKVEILQNGELIRIIDPASSSRIDLSAGQYTLQTGSRNAEFAVSPSEIKLTRGGKETVRVTQSQQASGDANNQSPSTKSQSDSSDSVTYNGKTFDEWLKILKTERKERVVCDGIEGVGELSKLDTEKRRIALEAIRSIIREHGDFYDRSEHDYLASFKRFFLESRPQEIIDFIVQELESGTRQSRGFTFWVSAQGALEVYDRKIHKERMIAFDANHLRLLNAWISAIEERVEKNDLESIKELSELASRTRYWRWNEWGDSQPMSSNIRRLPSDSDAVKAIRKVWQNQSHQLAKRALAGYLIEVSSDTKEVVIDLVKQLEEQSLSATENKQILEMLALCNESGVVKAIPALTKIGKQLTENLERNEDVKLEGFLNNFTRTIQHSQPDSFDMTLYQFSSNGFADLGFPPMNAAGGPGTKTFGMFYLTTNQGLLLSTIELQTKLCQFGKLPDDTTKPAIEWLSSLKKELDVSVFLKEVEEFQKSRRPYQHAFAFQFALNHFSEQAIEALQNSGSHLDQGENKPLVDPSGTKPIVGSGKSAEKTVPSPSPSVPTDAITYNGKTYDEWLKILKTERKESMVRDGIVGLGELTREDAGRRKIVLDAIRPIMRRYGSFIYGGADASLESFHGAFKIFFRKVPPEEIVDFIIEELKNGTPQSCEHLYWISSPGSLQIRDAIQVKEMLDCFESHQNKILAAWVERVETSLKAGDEDQLESLDRLGFSILYWSRQEWSQNVRKAAKHNPDYKIIADIRKAWQNQPDYKKRIVLGRCLLAISSDGREYLLDLCQQLQGETPKLNERMRILETIQTLQEPWGVEAIPELVKYGQRLTQQLDQDEPEEPKEYYGRNRLLSSSDFGFQIKSNGLVLDQSGSSCPIGATLTTNQGLLLSILELQTKLVQSGQLSTQEAEPTLQWLASLKKEFDTEPLIKDLEEKQAKMPMGGSGFGSITWTLDPDLAFPYALNQFADKAIEAIKNSSLPPADK